jgi:hypothetical protein
VTATWRDVCRGTAAALAALAAMTGTAAAGLLLLDADRVSGFGGLTAAVVALAVGGSAEFGAAPVGGLPLTVRGGVEVVPLGVALAGAVVLGWLLSRRRDGLLVRGAAAIVVLPAGAAAMAASAGGAVTLPGGTAAGGSGGCGPLPAGTLDRGGPLSSLDRGGSLGTLGAGFAVPVWPALAGAVVLVLAVVGVCWLVARFGVAVRGALWTALGLTAACLLAAWAVGGPVAIGGALLALPLVVFGVLSLGLGVPWTVRSDGALACVLDGVAPPAPGGPLTWAAVAVLLALGIASAGGGGGGPLRRAARNGAVLGVAVGASMGVLALLSGMSVTLGVGAFGFSFPLLDAGAAADPLIALGLGFAGGAVAGSAGGLLVGGLRAAGRSRAFPGVPDAAGRTRSAVDGHSSKRM